MVRLLQLSEGQRDEARAEVATLRKARLLQLSSKIFFLPPLLFCVGVGGPSQTNQNGSKRGIDRAWRDEVALDDSVRCYSLTEGSSERCPQGHLSDALGCCWAVAHLLR